MRGGFKGHCPKPTRCCSLLGLPEPEADELGRPVWNCTEVDVGKAYRKLSIVVHPDKNPGDDEARRAFEVLNKAHRMLKDPTSRVSEAAFLCHSSL